MAQARRENRRICVGAWVDRPFAERFAELAGAMVAAESVFGEQAILALIRVMGSTMARLAAAIVSAFLVNVEPGVSPADPVGLEVARANTRATELLPALPVLLDVLLRQHLLAARRSSLGGGVEAGYETRRLCVGFVDLVGSTALTQHIGADALGEVLSEFERVCADVVTGAGGRVIKLIGDEILYTSADERSACNIALTLAATFAEHASVPSVRAGLAAGEVLSRDGDVFGPTVNLAARAVDVASADEVVAPTELAAGAELPAQPLPPRRLKGFEGEIKLCRLRALPTAPSPPSGGGPA
jgi:adenylate cyclase